MYLNEFFEYKNRLAGQLINNPDIVSMMTDDLRIAKNPEDLMYTQIFPLEYVPETAEEGKTYICFDVDIHGVSNKTFLTPVLYIWVFTHRSLLRMKGGGILIDELVSEIDKMINGSRFYGLGELNLYSCKRFAPITDYQGKVLTYETKDFNRSAPTGQPRPTKRFV